MEERISKPTRRARCYLAILPPQELRHLVAAPAAGGPKEGLLTVNAQQEQFTTSAISHFLMHSSIMVREEDKEREGGRGANLLRSDLLLVVSC